MSELSALRIMPARALPEPALLRLQVQPQQQHFVGRTADLLADAFSRASCEPMAIVRGHRPVGLYCIETVARGIVGRDFDRPALGLRGFFIAAPFQGRGLGKQALERMYADLAVRHPHARLLVLTVDPVNHAALSLYQRVGFSDSGERYHGGHGGPQLLLWRALP